MNQTGLLLLGLTVMFGWWALPVHGHATDDQVEHDFRPPPQGHDRPMRDRRFQPDHNRRVNDAGRRPVLNPAERWLQNLKENNPEQFEKMQQLRREDPRAFRMEIRERLEKAKKDQYIAHHPRARKFMESLDPKQRETFDGLIMEQPGVRRKKVFKDKLRTKQINNEMMDMVRNYRRETDPEIKETIKRKLQQHIGDLFDQKEEQRRHHMERIEQQLQELSSSLELRHSKREAIIDRKLNELLEEDPLAW